MFYELVQHSSVQHMRLPACTGLAHCVYTVGTRSTIVTRPFTFYMVCIPYFGGVALSQTKQAGQEDHVHTQEPCMKKRSALNDPERYRISKRSAMANIQVPDL